MVCGIILLSWVLDITAVAITHGLFRVEAFAGYESNQWFYNFSMPLIIILFGWLYYLIFDNSRLKFSTVILISVFLLVHAANLIWLQGVMVTASYSIVLGQVFIGMFSFYYLRQSVEQYDFSPFRDFMFWFSVSTLISNVVTAPVTTLLAWLPFKTPGAFVRMYDIIGLYFGYYFCYLIISIGFLWTRRFRT